VIKDVDDFDAAEVDALGVTLLLYALQYLLLLLGIMC